MRKTNKPINALATTRARLGLTQAQIAEQLGISHSLVRMIETNQRFLSSDALVKLAALEIRLSSLSSVGKDALPDCVKELYDSDIKDYAEETSMHGLDCTYKARQLERKLEKMQQDHENLVSCLRNLEAILKMRQAAGETDTADLFFNRAGMLKKLSGCSPQQQAILKHKIAMLYASISLKKSIHPRYVHTNEKPIII